MSTPNRISRQQSSEITAFVTSSTIEYVAILKNSLYLTTIRVTDLEIERTHRLDRLTFQAVSLYGDIIDFTYEGSSARRVHRIIA